MDKNKVELRTTIQELGSIYEQWSKLEVKSFEGLMEKVIKRQLPCSMCKGKGKIWDYSSHEAIDVEFVDCCRCSGTGKSSIQTITMKRLISAWQTGRFS